MPPPTDYQIEEAFYLFCNDDTNLLAIPDLFPTLRALNIMLSDDLNDYLLEAVDLTFQSPPIDLEMFQDVVEVAMNIFDDAEHYQHIFKLIDKEGKGYINLDDLKVIRDQLKPQADKHDTTDQDLLDMLFVAQNGPYQKQTVTKNSLGSTRFPLFSSSSSTTEVKVTLKQFCKLMDNLEHNSSLKKL